MPHRKGMRLLTLLQFILCFCVVVASWQAELCVLTADTSWDALQQGLHGAFLPAP